MRSPSTGRSDNPEHLDVAVVGAGPCGLAVGAAATLEGLRVRLFDRGPITASLHDYPTYMTFFSTPERLEIEEVPFVVADAKPSRREALVYYRRVAEHFDLDVRQYEEVTDVEPDGGAFVLRSRSRGGREQETAAGAVVLSIGSFHAPNRLEVPGESLEKVLHAFREPYPYYDQDVLVVGGGNSAVEAALDLFRAGARVTVAHFASEFDRGVKPWILPDITNRIAAGEIAARWRHRVEAIEPGTATLVDVQSGERSELVNDWVFAMTGWRADYGFLERVGVEVDPASGVPRHHPETMETNLPGLYIAGVIAAGFDANKIFIENGRHHGRRIVRAIRA